MVTVVCEHLIAPGLGTTGLDCYIITSHLMTLFSRYTVRGELKKIKLRQHLKTQIRVRQATTLNLGEFLVKHTCN